MSLPNENIFNEILKYAETMKGEIDTSKTMDEIHMIKKLEK